MAVGFIEGITCHNASDSSGWMLVHVTAQPAFSLAIAVTLLLLMAVGSWCWLCQGGHFVLVLHEPQGSISALLQHPSLCTATGGTEIRPVALPRELLSFRGGIPPKKP